MAASRVEVMTDSPVPQSPSAPQERARRWRVFQNTNLEAGAILPPQVTDLGGIAVGAMAEESRQLFEVANGIRVGWQRRRPRLGWRKWRRGRGG